MCAQYHRIPSTNGENSEKEPLFDIDPSTGRKVTHKRINKAYLVHQRWLEKQKQIKERKQARAEGRSVPYDPELDEEEDVPFLANCLFSLTYTAFVVAIIALFAGQFIHGDFLWGYRGKWTNWRTYFPPTMREFTPEQLQRFNGESSGPIYLAIKGDVYDVTPGRNHYGKGGAYHFFAGRDASRAYVTGCFESHLTHDLRGFTEAEHVMLNQWHRFYAQHPKYFKIGTMRLPPINPASPIPPPCNEPRDQKPN